MARNHPTDIPKFFETERIQRINWKGFAIIAGVLLLAVFSYFPITYLISRSVRSSALAQAELARKGGEVDLALRHLQRYLDSHPDDIPALELKAKIISGIYIPWGQLLDAAASLDHLIRLDPKGPDRLETRRKLAEFYIAYSDELKRFADTGTDPDVERQQSRYAAAASIANQLLDDAAKANTKDAVAHKLLARAYEGQISELRGKMRLLQGDRAPDRGEKGGAVEDLRLRAINHYKLAIEIDPHDLDSSRRLASLYLNWTKEQTSADAVLDAMLQANPNSVEARLARYRLYSGSGRPELAREELEAILKLAPDNVDVRIEVASVALSQRKPDVARRQLDAIPAAMQDDLRVKILRGYMEFAEQHPDDAIDQWRRGLQIVGGSNQDLTWKLAFNLIQLGRYSQADPLRVQYQRLAKGDKNGMGKFLDALFDIGAGRLYEARRKLEKIKDVVPASAKADVLLALGRCCDMMGDLEASLMAYRSATTVAPTSVGPRLAIARHLQRRQPDEAIAELDRALEESPKEVNLLLEAIRLRLSLLSPKAQVEPRRAREIEELFGRLEAVAPNNAGLIAYRSEYMGITGQLPKAVASLREAVQGENRRTPEVWLSLAQALERLDRRNEAIAAIDEASRPENVGDRARLRIAKSRVLVRAGKGQAAKEALTRAPDAVLEVDRPELAQALGELMRELGDRDAALAAFTDWARLAPTVPTPALALLAMAQLDNDDRAAKLGLEALKAIGGDREPYGMAARALDLMRTDPARPGPPPADRLYEAEVLVKTLRKEVPSLRFGSLLEGMIQDYRGNLEGAVKSYKLAQKDDVLSPALPKLIEALIKLKRFNELEALKLEFNRELEARQRPGLAAEFDRIAAGVALKLSDKDRAEYFASKMAEGRRDNVTSRALTAVLDANGKTAEAEEALKGMVADRPNDPTVWLTLIAFQALRKTPEDVATTIAQARRDYKSERPELFLAQCYWFGKDVPKAKDAFQKALAKRPEDAITLRSMVEFYADINQVEPMEPILRKVLKLDPTTAWAARTLALLISSRSDPSSWPEAWALVAPGAMASGETPEDRLTRATILARCPESGKRVEAVRAFIGLANDLPITSPLALDTRSRLCQAMIEMMQFGQAWEAIRPIADDPSRPNPGALMLAIEALARSGRPDEADRRLQRLAALEPKTPQVSLASAWVLAARDKKADAVAALESAYHLAEKAPNAETIGMTVLERLGQLGDTDVSLRLARAITARWPARAWGLARVLVARKEYDPALAECEVAVEAGSPRDAMRIAVLAAVARRSDTSFVHKVELLGEKARTKAPKDFNIQVSCATVRHLQGRYDEEVAFYRKALELNPGNVPFLNNMAWTLCEGLNKPDEALKCVQEAISRDGESASYLDTRGVIEERLGQFGKAIADLEKSAKAEPAAATYFHLARVYMKSNNLDASRRCRELALKAKFDPEELDATDRSQLQEVMGQP